MTSAETKRIERLIATHRDLIAECGTQLATNFDIPAQSTIEYYCALMDITRTDWEKLTAVANGWEYAPPRRARQIREDAHYR